MSDLLNTFTTTNSNAFKWPYQRPLLAIPSQPPENIYRNSNLYLPRIDPDECKCNYHKIDTELTRYKELMGIEHHLCNNVVKVNREITKLVSSMLENSKNDEQVMKSVYQIAHQRKDAPLTDYRSLMAAVDAPVGFPIEPDTLELREAYRDPTTFRYSSHDTPAIQPAEQINFKRVPEVFNMWNKPFTGRSEYMDTISKLGLSNLKHYQQHLEPCLSSRRRWGDQNL
ncbi:uncharacterized protein LOC123261311 [Cotesia glomerata]|uniref:Uncharacterized protein n=1 Tax=Cotesia glomerata TaxID=32391 RepID=A0AAV7II24_COTGL|nr:uncharacterized protein LOC123261311 [Cotesia glomerata]KAH0550731.1 hypothetical protein KQX54_020649 [Cotesia glomerata]